MRILLTVHQFYPQYAAGTEVLTYSVARELTSRGHTVHVFTGHPSSADLHEQDRFDEYDFEGIHVYRFHHAYTPMAGQTSMIEVGYDNRLAANYFEGILRGFRPDIVHFFHLNRLGTGLIERAVREGIPRFMTPTDFWTICPTGQLVYGNGNLCSGPSAHAGNCIKHFAQTNQRGLTRVIAEIIPTAGIAFLARLTQKGALPSYPKHNEVNAIASRLGVNIARLNQLSGLVVPNGFMKALLIQYGVLQHLIIQSAYGIDVTSIEGGEHRSTPRHPLRIGFIGTVAPHKGCDVLINAFNALPIGNAVLNIYGNMEVLPQYSSKLKQLSNNNDAIKFCGTFHNSKIGEVLFDLDVLVVPSLWYENTPLVVYSAQAARCPVVASDFPGISEVIRDNINGLLFTPGSVKALSEQLTRFMEEPGLATRLSSNSQPPKSITTYVDELLNIWSTS